MTSFRSVTVPLLSLMAILAGCSAEAGTSSGAESAGNARSTIVAESSSSTANSDRPHRPGGPDFLVHGALRAPLDLTAAQRTTIEGLTQKSAPPKPAFDPARATKLAAQIRTNTFDATPEGPDASARQAHVAEMAKALTTLHDTLTPEQRTKLVDDIKSHAPKGEDHGAAHEGRPEGHAQGPGAHGFDRGPMRMLAGLDLTDAQKEEIRSKLEAGRPAPPSAEQREAMKAKFKTMRAEMDAKLESFKGNAFDATAFVTPPKDLAPPVWVAPVNELQIITSVLTPAQREKLAARVEQGLGALGRKDQVRRAPTAQ